jgi:hypothetical protein
LKVVNLTDSELSLQITQLDVAEDSNFSESLTLQPLEISGLGSVPIGRHILVFTGPLLPLDISCTLQIERSESIQFVAVPEGIAVSSDRFSPATADDIDVITSSFCRR